MIKLVASDIDGTLLNRADAQLSPALFDTIRALRRKGIAFCAASGRQYTGLRRLFAPVADDILYCCDNGAVAYQNGSVLAKTPLPQDLCEQVTAQLLAQPGCEVHVSGADISYVLQKSPDEPRRAPSEVGNHRQYVRALSDIPEEIIKISAYCDKPSEEYEAIFAPVWSRYLNVAVAGKYWLDFTLAHKGTALAEIVCALDLSPREVMVFGDNFNDIPMFRFAGVSYAMEGAAEAVKAAATHTCTDVNAVLRTLL